VQLVDETTDVWAKAGWIEFPGAVRNELYEWRDQSGAHALLVGQEVSIFWTGARVERLPSGLWRIWVGPSDTPAVRVSSWLYGSPKLAQMATETHSFADQMPGGTQSEDRMTFEDTRVVVGGAGQDFGGTGFNSNPTEYRLYTWSPAYFTVWDKRCPT
jgi:hypothetical protein